ncbi:MAG: TOBE domain-containing protein [Acetobacterium woodii]|nr:TOBE domain-containing protein [Acetobacterium woodii]
MKLSARNQFPGKVETILEGAVNTIVTLKTDVGNISATISVAAVKELGLAVGKDATAIIKATEVLIGTGDFKLSARNQISGEITAVQEGAVNAIVTLKAAGGSLITSTISLAAVKELGLAPGVKAVAIVKATSVIIAA